VGVLRSTKTDRVNHAVDGIMGIFNHGRQVLEAFVQFQASCLVLRWIGDQASDPCKDLGCVCGGHFCVWLWF
jgi:hypothetical protein